jgi:hypothetical protein
VRHGLDEDLDAGVVAQGEAAPADLEQAGGAVAQHLEAYADADAEFAEAGDPGGVAGDVGDLAPLAGAEAFQRQEDGVHGRLAEGSSGLAC